MQFIVTGHDGKDDQAMTRRLAKREAHLSLAESMKNEGILLYAAALLDEQERMVGSTLMMEFPDRSALDAWLENEPYVVGEVWKTIEITMCKVPPFFKS